MVIVFDAIDHLNDLIGLNFIEQVAHATQIFR